MNCDPDCQKKKDIGVPTLKSNNGQWIKVYSKRMISTRIGMLVLYMVRKII